MCTTRILCIHLDERSPDVNIYRCTDCFSLTKNLRTERVTNKVRFASACFQLGLETSRRRFVANGTSSTERLSSPTRALRSQHPAKSRILPDQSSTASSRLYTVSCIGNRGNSFGLLDRCGIIVKKSSWEVSDNFSSRRMTLTSLRSSMQHEQ